MSEIIDSVDLHCQEGGSDKVYFIYLIRDGDLYRVDVKSGKRGGTLMSGTKTQKPVDLAAARKIFTALENEKVGRKRYKVIARLNEDGQGSGSGTLIAAQLDARPPGVGFAPQLVNPIDREEALRLIADDHYCAQQKVDGDHRLAKVAGDAVTGANKRSEGVVVPADLEADLRQLQARLGTRAGLVLDGEYLGGGLAVFDVLMYDGAALNTPYEERARLLDTLRGAAAGLATLRFLETAWTAAEKQALFDRLEREQKEGVVFKLKAGLPKPGRPAKGGDHLKYQFRKRADVIVRPAKNGKRALDCWLWQDGALLPVGGCASGVTQAIYDRVSQSGEEVAEIRYLYATAAVADGGQLYQAVYLRQRTDKPGEECLGSQLRTTDKSL